jgi:hypothetical protein
LARLLLKGPLPEGFVDVLAEFTFIQSVLRDCRFQWRPISGGSQFGEFAKHADFFRVLLRIAEDIVAKQESFRE